MKLILALSLIVVQTTLTSSRSASKSLSRPDDVTKSKIADLILPLLRDQEKDDKNLLEVVPYTKKNKWKDLKRVAAITPISKKEKKGPLAIILTAANMKGIKKKKKAIKTKSEKKGEEVNSREVNMSFIVSDDTEDNSDSSEEATKARKELVESLLKHARKHAEKAKKEELDNANELMDSEIVEVINTEDKAEITEDIKFESNETADASDAFGIAHKIEPKTHQHKTHISKAITPDSDTPEDHASINLEEYVETTSDIELSAFVNSDDISEAQDINEDDVTPQIYVIEAPDKSNGKAKEAEDDSSDDSEDLLALPDMPLQKIDDLNKYTVKRKNPKHNKAKVQTIISINDDNLSVDEQSEENDEDTSWLWDQLLSNNAVKVQAKTTNISEAHTSTDDDVSSLHGEDAQSDDVTSKIESAEDAASVAVSDSLPKDLSKESDANDELGRDLLSASPVTENSKEISLNTLIDEDLSARDEDLSAKDEDLSAKDEDIVARDSNNLELPEARSVSLDFIELTLKPSAEERESPVLEELEENTSFGTEDSVYSQEREGISNEFDNLLLPTLSEIPGDMFNNYDENKVKEVIEELNENIKEIRENSINEAVENDKDCSKNKEDKDGKKLYNLSFVFNKK